MKQVDKDIEKIIIPDLVPLFSDDKSHEEICQEYIRMQFVSNVLLLCYLVVVHILYTDLYSISRSFKTRRSIPQGRKA